MNVPRTEVTGMTISSLESLRSNVTRCRKTHQTATRQEPIAVGSMINIARTPWGSSGYAMCVGVTKRRPISSDLAWQVLVELTPLGCTGETCDT